MKKQFLILMFFCLRTHTAGAQEDTLRITLSEAVRFALKNNKQLAGVRLDENMNQQRIREIRSGALPQINVNGNFSDNFQRPSQILPGEVFGTPGEDVAVQFGTKYTVDATGQLTQTIFNPALFVGMKAAKESQGYYELNSFKTREDIVYQIVNLYMQLEMVKKQRELAEGNISRMEQLLRITKAQYDEGIIKKVDLNQIQVNYTNIQTQLSNTENNYAQLLNNLKLTMGLPLAQPLAISAEPSETEIPVSRSLQLNDNISLNLLDYQIRLQQLDKKSIKAGYLPTLSAFFNYGYQALGNELFETNTFNSFPNGAWGLRLSVPLFDGFRKNSQVAQSEIKLQQLKLNREYMRNNVETQFRNASSTLAQNEKVLKAQEDNMKLAEELYEVANLSYTEGVAPLSELINAENGLKEAQTQYLTAMLQTRIAELDLMKNSGQLSNLIKTGTN